MEFKQFIEASQSLSPYQKKILALLDKDGKSQVEYSPEIFRSIKILSKKNLLNFRMSGKWIAISTPELEPDEPGEHDLIWHLTYILDKLSEELNGQADNIWDLMKILPGIDFHSLQSAISYGIRKGKLAKIGEWGIRVI